MRREERTKNKEYYREIGRFLNTKYKEGLREILRSERFQNILKIRNLSYAYSIFNTVLIVSQRPELLENGQLVLPRYKWARLGRKIKKDAEPIWIWRPNPKKIYEEKRIELPENLKKYRDLAVNKSFEEFKKEMEGKEEIEGHHRNLIGLYYDLKRGYMVKRVPKGEKLYFKPEKVYAQGDTYGRELPDLKFKTLKGNDYKRFYEMIRDSSPIPVTEVYSVKNIPYHGFYNPKDKTITIRRGKDYNAMLSTLIHELSHAIRDKEGMMSKDRDFEEAVVESTSIAVLTRLGVKEAMQYRGEYVLSFLNAQSEKDLEKKSKELFKEADMTVRKLLEEVPAIQVAIAEVDREFIEYEHKLMKEQERMKEEGKEIEEGEEMEMGA